MPPHLAWFVQYFCFVVWVTGKYVDVRSWVSAVILFWGRVSLASCACTTNSPTSSQESLLPACRSARIKDTCQPPHPASSLGSYVPGTELKSSSSCHGKHFYPLSSLWPSMRTFLKGQFYWEQILISVKLVYILTAAREVKFLIMRIWPLKEPWAYCTPSISWTRWTRILSLFHSEFTLPAKCLNTRASLHLKLSSNISERPDSNLPSL